jgi:ABC-2 type transport system ATP-binding protein
MTIVMSTPYLDEAERCSRVALLHGGRLLALDTPAALRATLPGTMFEVVAPDHRQAARALASLHGVVSVEMFGERAHVRLGPGEADGQARLGEGLRAAGIGTATVREVPASLEDVFVNKLGEAHA